MAVDSTSPLFIYPVMTGTGGPRALVKITGQETLWFNTGTLCNIAYGNCYIEPSPENDRLEYLSLNYVAGYQEKIDARGWAQQKLVLPVASPFWTRMFWRFCV